MHLDTCGVHNLHGMPAILSALFSAIFAYFATKDAYGDSLFTIFPGMKNSTLLEDEHEKIIGVREFAKNVFKKNKITVRLVQATFQLNFSMENYFFNI